MAEAIEFVDSVASTGREEHHPVADVQRMDQLGVGILDILDNNAELVWRGVYLKDFNYKDLVIPSCLVTKVTPFSLLWTQETPNIRKLPGQVVDLTRPRQPILYLRSLCASLRPPTNRSTRFTELQRNKAARLKDFHLRSKYDRYEVLRRYRNSARA